MDTEDADSGGYSPTNFDQGPVENCRLWGEEKEENAVFGVFLKKVRYQRPSAIVQIVQASGNHNLSVSSSTSGGRRSIGSNDDDLHEEIAHLMWETVKVKVLKAGSLEKVVEAISNEDSDVQATHLSVFLATYRAFATAPEVMKEIIKIYKRANSEILRKAMLDSIHVWLDTYSEDFDPGSEGFICLQKLVLPFTHEENLKSLSLKVQYKLRTRRKMRKSASVHSLRTQIPLQIKMYSLLSIPESHFAQQLTYIDKELFLNLRVWECLGGLWKRRCGCPTVHATVEQFNALSGRVVATILLDPTATTQLRAKYLDKWIRVAQELRLLKNFSSLKAIISGLECNQVWRLQKVWSLISKDRISIFSQLSQIFSEDNNRSAQRTLLEAEGTAKFPTPTKNPKDRKFFARVLRGQGTAGRGVASTEIDSPNGTVPYLGTFLTDLTFIDSAISDKVHGDLINFEKRRKEFEILAQLKLLQGSAKGYRLEEDPYFSTWFNSLVVLDDKVSYELSLGIQPEKNPPPTNGHRKTDSFTSHSSSENIESSSALQRKGSIPSSNESSILYGTTANGSTGSGIISPSPDTSSSSLVVKVSTPVKGDVMYKSIMIGNSDHTPKVIALALEKLGLEEEDPKNFNLVQILPMKELKFPPNANIFYAVDTSARSTGGDIRLEVRPNKFTLNHNNNNNNNLTNAYGKSSVSRAHQQPRST
ncbi:ral guanine nucleotide dissociation stimulator isoform X2 [Folsomia candida]|uniref:ral guanine nucleotide dissociation stimulator isoform X2 n=1 Tax=Folsomia candida TaxID=158441 RepID=UPI000B8FC666|nr:ral guanine nucleotide dissociation stimulator isoform X2 [Folsomia candida]